MTFAWYWDVLSGCWEEQGVEPNTAVWLQWPVDPPLLCLVSSSSCCRHHWPGAHSPLRQEEEELAPKLHCALLCTRPPSSPDHSKHWGGANIGAQKSWAPMSWHLCQEEFPLPPIYMSWANPSSTLSVCAIYWTVCITPEIMFHFSFFFQVNREPKMSFMLCFIPKDRPPSNSWKKIELSREYKNGNQLREYQLEGLNWLLFNWYNRYVFWINKINFYVSVASKVNRNNETRKHLYLKFVSMSSLVFIPFGMCYLFNELLFTCDLEHMYPTLQLKKVPIVAYIQSV